MTDAMQIERVVLEGPGVRLEPLGPQHLEGLRSAVSDGRLWEIRETIVPPPEELPQFIAAAEAAFAGRQELPFAIYDKLSAAIVGSTRFRCIVCDHRRVEIGFTFIAKSKQRTHVNRESKFLMLTHAFERWRCNRVELLTDVLNTRSRSAIAGIGAHQEGIVRSHMIMRDGRVRDSALFSIVAGEWPDIKTALAPAV